MWIYLILHNPFQMLNNNEIISISGNEDRIILALEALKKRKIFTIKRMSVREDSKG